MNYPPLRLPVLSALAELKERLLAEPDLLDGPEIAQAYDGETLVVLRKVLAPQIITKTIEKEVASKRDRGRPTKDLILSEENQEKVRTELQDLLDALTEMGTGEGLATNERIQITKTKASIVEQILKMQERSTNIKRVSEFMEVTMSILEDLVDETGREVFLSRVEAYR